MPLGATVGAVAGYYLANIPGAEHQFEIGGAVIGAIAAVAIYVYFNPWET